MISNNLIIKRYREGVTLVPPSFADALQDASVQSVMNLPANMYFMDRNSVMRRMNDRTADTSGYLSAADAIGKSLRDVAKLETIANILANDRSVVNSGRYRINAESYVRFDGLDMVAVSIKFPWLQNNVVEGIFGCSMLLGDACAPSLSQTLSQLMHIGLLTPGAAKMPVLVLNQAYFDQRDHAIMRLLVRGNTAKQIARVLGLSYRTIEHRVESIKFKLQVKSRAELIERLVDEFIFLPTVDGS